MTNSAFSISFHFLFFYFGSHQCDVLSPKASPHMWYILSNLCLSKYYLSLKSFLIYIALSLSLVLIVLRVCNTPSNTYYVPLMLPRLDGEQLESWDNILEKLYGSYQSNLRCCFSWILLDTFPWFLSIYIVSSYNCQSKI